MRVHAGACERSIENSNMSAPPTPRYQQHQRLDVGVSEWEIVKHADAGSANDM